MKVISVTPLQIPHVQVIRTGRFTDDRGYFTEIIRVEDLAKITSVPYFAQAVWTQVNESYSHEGVIRGLHFQWAPHQGKLVRATEGTLIDLALDIRAGSPTEGKITGYRLSFDPGQDHQDLVWVPPGFAHGFMALSTCRIEYLCTGSWSPLTERAIRINDPLIDWSLMDMTLADTVRSALETAVISAKDLAGLSLDDWRSSPDHSAYMRTLPQ